MLCELLEVNNSGCAKVAPEFVRMTSLIDTRVLPTATSNIHFRATQGMVGF